MIIGIDLGTTTISLVVYDPKMGCAVECLNRTHNCFVPTCTSWEKIQHVPTIVNIASDMLQSTVEKYGHVDAIGLTGQMHGIVYTDAEGYAVSDLYTWQDGRANVPDATGETLANELKKLSGSPIASGYGLATHIWNLRHDCVPPTAVGMTTVSSYLGMHLCGCQDAVIHKTDAASLGFYDVVNNHFEVEQLEALGVDVSILPIVYGEPHIMGYYRGIPVVIGIGDNQASFLGAVGDSCTSMLINFGTGSQLSAYSSKYETCALCETRPYIDDGYILVGAALCGGRAFAILESFFRKCIAMIDAGVDREVYPQMHQLCSEILPRDELPMFLTAFSGSREDVTQRAAITNLTEQNFTPAHLIWATLYGMVQEMKEYYLALPMHMRLKATGLYTSGNMVRRSPALASIIEEEFGMPVNVPMVAEEAAFGACLFAKRAI